MQIKRYEAVSTSEAMKKIKTDLGPDAVVLSTRKLKGGIEVVAAREGFGLETGKGEMVESGALSLLKTELDQVKALIQDVKRERDVCVELAELKETVGVLVDVLGVRREKSLPPVLSKIYHHLISVGISKERTCALLEEVKGSCPRDALGDYYRMMGVVEDTIRKSITPSYRKPKRKRLVAFVGPAGEGKTTTLAKVAARSLFGEKRSVGVITTDTYRIGGAEQLKIYTDIMDVPMEIASEREGFKRVLRTFSDRDVILIDTPGKGSRGEGYALGLKGCCSADIPLEMNLVLSMTSSRESIMDAVRGSGADYDNIIFTKLDDARKYGVMYDVVDSVGKPVSYIANGQNVPRDLMEMDPAGLARLIVENGTH
ncbi:MAG: flagellar biosynthesis protein FlhF [Deltaproteobacteria bacterium]|nr:flagellar biosynthesis protein FlhF [Deltaproteobacteria bacterium]